MRGPRRSTAAFAGLLFLGHLPAIAQAEQPPIAQWTFDGPATTSSPAAPSPDVFRGNLQRVPGVHGEAAKLDGFTAYILRQAKSAPTPHGDFSIEAWIALATYPWNWCPIVDHQSQHKAGWFFGIDAEGRLALQIALPDGWREAVSQTPVPLGRWQHVAGMFKAGQGLTVYIDGRPVGALAAEGPLVPAKNLDMLIGRSRDLERPAGVIRPAASLPIFSYLDGVLDELRIWDLALSRAEIEEKARPAEGAHAPPLSSRALPRPAPEPGPFGAFYTTLKHYPEWDTLWRGSEQPDVVVRFDAAPYRFVFWRGTGYVPCWVTGEGLWYTNEFNETWGNGAVGCAEPMSDKQCRYSRVRILESGPARAVIHWRYALADVNYTFARVDAATGWGDWSDEVYTLYPDGVGVRKITLWSSQPMQPHEFQDSIPLHQPGHRPEDDIEKEALILANMKGGVCRYSWADGVPKTTDKPDKANIQIINLKSATDPFLIVPDAPCTVSPKGPRFRPYRGEIRPAYSIFPWWNHWPVAQIPSDGRNAFASDRPAHSCITNQTEWADFDTGPTWRTRIMLHGLTDKPADQLVPLAKSWLHPPALQIRSGKFTNSGYDPTQRAYILTCVTPGHPSALELTFAAGENSPLVNLALVINDWGSSNVKLRLDGKTIQPGKDFRPSHRQRLEGTDLILWLATEASHPVSVALEPASTAASD